MYYKARTWNFPAIQGAHVEDPSKYALDPGAQGIQKLLPVDD